ncbi:MAG: hypothetical protein LBU58_05475, partial [Clostridiales bacterium]|nr:hypothetical protein [Clostridiales bacterium]
IVVENVRRLWYNEPAAKLAGSDAVDFSAPGGTRILNGNFAQLGNFVYYGFEQMLREFVRCADTGGPPVQDAEDALKTFRLVGRVKELANCV